MENQKIAISAKQPLIFVPYLPPQTTQSLSLRRLESMSPKKFDQLVQFDFIPKYPL